MLPNIPTFTVLTANEAYLKVTGTTLNDLAGIGFLEAFPENPEDQVTKNVAALRSSLTEAVLGKCPTTMPGQRYDIPIRGTHKFETRYWTVTNSPIINQAGEVEYIVHIPLDITAAYNLAKKEKIAYEVAEGQRRQLNQSFKQAPLAVALLSGANHMVEAANVKMLNYVGRTAAEVIGYPLADVVPRIKELYILDHLDKVFTTGKAYHGNEVHMVLQPATNPVEKYFNIVYQPIINEIDETTNILITVADVTEQVLTRKALERVVQEKTDAQEQLQLAVESAQMGTWFINTETMEMEASPRLKEFLGFHPDENVSLDMAIQQVPAPYQERVIAAIKACFNKQKDYELEHPIVGFHNHQLRWVRATGRLYDRKGDKPSHFSGTIVDITERKHNEQRKNDFIGIVSHELKTPLTSVKAYLQLLQQKPTLEDDAWRVSLLGKMENQLNKMQRMISGFLSVAALESGKLHLHKERFDLDQVIQEMVDEATMAYTQYHIHFASCNCMPIEGDRDKIGQVITNLLSNAIKYSPADSHIYIQCTAQEQQVQVSIRDEGIGVDKEHLPRLFERFYRVESEKMKSFSGFGIGLYLCAEIIERHGGRIWAASEGKGATFYFTLPLAP